MRHRISKLGDLYRTCSTHLFQNLARAGISHWWSDTPDSPKGGAVFAYYDAEATCLRMLPQTPKYFEAALRSDLISNADATLLSRRLIRTLDTLLKGYSGCFASELTTGEVGRIIKSAAELDDFSLHEAHQNLVPDDIYAAIPWPFIPGLHFNMSQFAPAGLRSDYISDVGRDPMRAMNIAVDVVTFGPSFYAGTETIASVLDWLRGPQKSRSIEKTLERQNANLRKIVVPCLTSGLQGIAFGMFTKLPVEKEPFVTSQLQQFAATVGEHLAYYREQELVSALERAANLEEYAQAFMRFLPPAEHILFTSQTQQIAFRLQWEGDYLAGYTQIAGDELEAASSDPANEALLQETVDSEVKIFAKMPLNMDTLNPLFTFLRVKPRLAVVPALSTDEVKPLSRAELGALYHGLRRQIRDGRGAIAASKKLFLVDQVLQNFDEGEVTLTNSKARDFTQRILGRSIGGYHVSGKAAKKFAEDIQKLASDKFLFEALSTHSLRVRWRTKSDPGEALSLDADMRKKMNIHQLTE